MDKECMKPSVCYARSALGSRMHAFPPLINRWSVSQAGTAYLAGRCSLQSDMDDTDDADNNAGQSSTATTSTATVAPAHVWLGLSIIASLSFYAQALVTEERFVPAVNVIATHWNMPSDIAGATIMAAAASSPELFASFLSLFVTHSSLGLGTIVGSEIFNQLVIVAGSIQYARNNRLKLDRAILVREVLFYGLSLVLFLLALRDRRPTDDDDDIRDHIYIGLGDGLLLLGGYGLYVLVCAYFKQILSIVEQMRASVIRWKGSDETSNSGGLEYNAYEEERNNSAGTKQQRRAIGQTSRQATIDVPEMPFLRQLSHEPRANFHSVMSQDDLFSLNDGDVVSDIDPSANETSSSAANRSLSPTGKAITDANMRCTSPRRLLHTVLSSSSKKPSQLHDLDELERNDENADVSCFLWQQSQFYTKARVDLNAWHLRWFTFNDAFVESVPNRRDFNLHRLRYAGLADLQVDNDHLVMKFTCNVPESREFVLMAPSRKVLEVVVKACEHIMANENSLAANASFDSIPSIDNFGREAEEIRSLVEFPDSGAAAFLVVIYVILLPVKALVHYTVPDVRVLPPEKSSTQRSQALISIFSCLLWIIFGSLAMCWSLESLGALMGISDMLMGVTISAAGTSLPVLVASCICARQGLGNMAVSNTFGSNSFNILLGLGLPWTLYCAFVSRGEPYHGIVDEGITESAFWLSGVLLVFIVLVVASNFVLYRWHALIFIALYVAYVAYAVLQDLGLL